MSIEERIHKLYKVGNLLGSKNVSESIVNQLQSETSLEKEVIRSKIVSMISKGMLNK
ncbi:hypothetical protein [Ekhidna sp.]